MSTRAYVALQISNDKAMVIYNHYDGYPSGVGATLLHNYTSFESVFNLVRMGSASIIGDEIGEKHDFDSHIKEHRTDCLFYNRDRGESGQEPFLMDASDIWDEYEDYDYLFKDGQWFWRRSYNREWSPLTEDDVK